MQVSRQIIVYFWVPETQNFHFGCQIDKVWEALTYSDYTRSLFCMQGI